MNTFYRGYDTRRIIHILPLFLAIIENESDRAFLSTLYEENYEAMLRKAKAMLKKRIDKLFRDVVLRYAEDQSKILIEQRPEGG